ncbi:MAG: VWA domain-containing protein [Acidimicrobiales bacterium]
MTARLGPAAVLRAAAALLTVFLAVAAVPAAAGAQGAPTTTAASGSGTAPKTPSENPAIDDLVGCVQGSKRLLVLFLIDESASLKQNDPENRRIDAARSALDSLTALASSEGAAAPEVQVAMAAFSNDYRLVQDWTAAGTGTQQKLDDALGSFSTLNKGIDTDFVNALTAGQEALADQAAEITAAGGAAPCKAVLLFTDGGYDIAVRPTKEDQDRLGLTKPYAPNVPLTNQANVTRVEAAGREALCRKGGLADRLRNDDVTLLTVALSGSVTRRAQLPLAAASAGTADDYRCGTETERPQGAYLPAEGIDVLVAHFNEIGARLAGGNVLPGSDQVKVCDGKEPCEEGTRTFTLDDTLRQAEILALAKGSGTLVRLEGPKGAVANITAAGTTKVGDVAVTARDVAGRGLSIRMERPANLDTWSGQWRVSIQAPKGDQAGTDATLQIFVFSDISITVTSLRPLTRGASSPIEAKLSIPGGADATKVVASSSAEARLQNPVTGAIDTVKLTGPPTGPFKGTYATPADTTSNALILTVEAKVTTVSGSVVLSQSAANELLVLRPAGSIQFVPGSLKMPSLTGDGTTEAELTVTGGDKPGCVWFGPTKVPDAPEGTAPIVVTADGKALATQASCVKVAARQRLTVTVEAAPSGRGSGTVRGTLTVFEKVDGAAKPTTTEIPFRFEIARGVDQARRLLLAVAMLVAGLGIPLVALLIINSVTARFQALDAIRAASLPVAVSGNAISRIDGDYPRGLALRDADFGSLATAGTTRRFTFSGVVFRARASRNPFGAAMAMAAPEGGAEKLKGNVGSRVELDLALAGSWVFLLDPDRTRRADRGDAYGQLLVFVAEGDIGTQVNKMMPDITDRLPATASRLAGVVRTTKRKPPAKPSKRSAKAQAAGEEASEAEVVGLDDAEAPDAGAPPASDVVDPVAPAAEPAPAPEVAAGPEAEAASGAASEVEPEAAPELAADDRPAPAAPAGFGGAAVDRPVAPSAPADAGADDDGDDQPPSAPVGFGGGPR